MTAMPELTEITASSSSNEHTEPNAPQNGREARNLAEKNRRDKLNASIQELATMVPHVVDATRRLDKTAVLRFAAHGLRLQYVFGKSTKKRGVLARNQKSNIEEKLQLMSQPQLTSKLMQLLNSFFITLTCHGQIVLISENVEQLLGHCQSDLYGENILQITHPDDVANFRQQLIPQDMESLFRTSTYNDDNHIKHNDDDTNEYEELRCYSDGEGDDESDIYHHMNKKDSIDERLRSDHRCFFVRLARAGARSETNRSYEIVKIDGCFRRSDCSTSAGNFPIVSQFTRRSRCNSGSNYGTNFQTAQHEAITQAAMHGISGNDIVLVAMARIIRPQRVINRLINANQLEYQTRHLIDGRIIDCDQRIGIVAGYMKDEVRNLSPFSFMHQDDVRWVIVALRQMYDCNSDYGESCYRLLSRNGHFIYLQTRGYLEIDKNTNKVHSFVCINTLLDEEEGRRKVQEMKDKFSIIIKTKIPSNSLQDVPASQNPQQLERIVLYLIKNLQKRNDEPIMAEDSTDSNHSNVSLGRSTKTPPIALIPPEPASVRNSISKSVDVVNITAAKNLQYSQKNDIRLSPSSSNKDFNQIPNQSSILEQAISPSAKRTTVLKIGTTPSTPSPSSVSSKESNSIEISELSEFSCCSSSASLSPQLTPTKAYKQKSCGLKRLHISPQTDSDDCISPAKRHGSNPMDVAIDQDEKTSVESTATFGLHTVLTKSLNKLDHPMQKIDNNTRLHCKKSVQFADTISNANTKSTSKSKSLPKTSSFDNQLSTIFAEGRKQREILINFQTQYDLHLQKQNQ